MDTEVKENGSMSCLCTSHSRSHMIASRSLFVHLCSTHSPCCPLLDSFCSESRHHFLSFVNISRDFERKSLQAITVVCAWDFNLEKVGVEFLLSSVKKLTVEEIKPRRLDFGRGLESPEKESGGLT